MTLEELTGQSWIDTVRLRAIANELSFRSTKRSSELRERVARRIDELSKERNDGGAKSRASSGQASHDSCLRNLEQLKSQLAAARGEIVAQRQTIEQLKRQSGQTSSPRAALYAKISVLETLPDFALKALRKVFQKEFHPDRWPDQDKAKITKRFLSYEDVFESIGKARRLG